MPVTSGGTFWRSPIWPNPTWIYGNEPYLGAHAGYKLNEILLPNTPPMELRSPGRRSGLGIVAVPNPPMFMDGGLYAGPQPPNVIGPGTSPTSMGPSSAACPPSGAPQTMTSNPVFLDPRGNPIQSAVCGSQYSMTVPGFEGQQLFISQMKNGAQQFAGQMSIPMSLYTSVCNQDEGSYQTTAYTLDGSLLGSTTFTVQPGAASATPAAPGGAPSAAPPPGTTSAVSPLPVVPAPTTTTTVGSFFSSLTTTEWILLAAVGLIIINQTGKR